MPQPMKIQKDQPKINREGWLTELAIQVQPLFRGFNLDPYRLTCGWPTRMPLGRRVKVLGQCMDGKASKGGFHEICISPLLDNPLIVAGVVCHEMGHVAAGVKSGHKGLFIKVCKQIGLTKNKPTQAAPGPLLEEHLQKLLGKIGPYPHQAVVPTYTDKEKSKSSFSVICPECGCLCHMSNKWIQEVGFPTCACGAEMTLKGEVGLPPSIRREIEKFSSR